MLERGGVDASFGKKGERWYDLWGDVRYCSYVKPLKQTPEAYLPLDLPPEYRSRRSNGESHTPPGCWSDHDRRKRHITLTLLARRLRCRYRWAIPRLNHVFDMSLIRPKRRDA